MLTASILMAGPFFSNEKEVLKEHPLKSEHRSVDHGGTKATIDTYRDGIGVIVGTFEADEAIDNTPVNRLVYKYGEKAKANNTTVLDQVLYGEDSSEEDKKIMSTLTSDGMTCNTDHEKENMTYINNVCQGGTWKDGVTCDDNDPQTLTSAYLNDICTADKSDGIACNDGSDLTENDVWTSGVCNGTQVSGVTFANGDPGLSAVELSRLEAYLGTGAFNLTKLFDHSMGNPKDSKPYIAHKKNILILVRTTDGHMIGGFTGLNLFRATNTTNYGYKTKQGGEFIFNLTLGIKSNITDTRYGIYDYGVYGPTFGGGHDLYINGTMGAQGYTNIHSYREFGLNIQGGSGLKYFTPTAFYAYQVN